MKALWDSTKNLFERFGIEPTLDEQGRVMFEEIWEFTHAISDMEMNGAEVPQEAVDVLVTIIAMLQITGHEYGEFQEAIERVVFKNDSKTMATHAVNGAGKIARINLSH
jgi:NTP pyrophosphatase (non-canonical NTP hydrolase)